MLSSLAIAVIMKNSLHIYFNFSQFWCSFLFLIFSLIYLLFFLYGFKASTKQNINNNINDREKKSKNENEINGGVSKIKNEYEINEYNSFEYQNDKYFFPLSNYEQNKYTEDEHNTSIERNDNEKSNYFASFNNGHLDIEFQRITISVQIKNMFEFYFNIFNKKFILLLLINFFSRFQKVKFKTDIKNIFEEIDNKFIHMFYLDLIFTLTYLITFILLFFNLAYKFLIEDKNKKKVINRQEKFILYLIIIINIILVCFSYNNMNLKNTNRNFICFVAIALSGNINYLYYVFYSTKKRNFITMSGYFAFSSIVLKIIDAFFEPYNKMIWFKIQVISSFIGISLSFYVLFLIEEEYKHLIENDNSINEDIEKKKRKKKIILFVIIIIILLIPFFCIPIHENDKNKEKKDDMKLIDTFYFNSSSSNYNIKNYKLLGDAIYKICVYGPKAKKGGRGGKICGGIYFEVNTTLNLTFGGQQARGKGGTKCGYWEGGEGFNGAGYTMAQHFSDFFVVAGGGGGNSESGNEGGDAECDGKGYFNGKGASKYEGGDGGSSLLAELGIIFKGGDGVGEPRSNQFCGGGGGAGYYGGGAGHWGEEGNDGGGGGGSNYCKADFCSDDGINYKYDYSTIEIYKKLAKNY